MIASHDLHAISADHIVGLETKYRCQLTDTSLDGRQQLFADVLIHLDDGTLFLTNKRIIFMGRAIRDQMQT